MRDGRSQILIVEDEPAQREVLAYALKKAGYQVRVASDGDEAELELAEERPDLVLLDWMMPGVSGLELCRRIRATKGNADLPVIMLTARGEEDDVVRGLDVGADDYVAKPYSMTELQARIRRALRRKKGSVDDRLTVEDVTMDLEAQRVLVAGQEVKLGPIEFRLLQTFMERPGRVFERAQLLDLVWGRDSYVGDRTVDVHVGRLRKALGDGTAAQIRTVRGRGYSFG